ncbi:MAG: TonB family protein [Fibrobacteria bacterium]
MLAKLGIWTVKILGTMLINLVLFAIIPIVQALLKDNGQEKGNKDPNYQIVMEMKTEEKEKQKPKARQIREVKMGSQGSSIKSQSFKFQPDLAAAGGGGDGVDVGSQDMEVMVFNESEVDEPPRELSVTPLEFPEVARSARASGTLEVEIVIGRDGRVESLKINESPHPSISREAERTIPRWKFQPGKNKGIPVRIRALKRIKFKLN